MDQDCKCSSYIVLEGVQQGWCHKGKYVLNKL